ncbi:MAG TPA: Ig-like domain-containing protein, partial [Pseudosphingobacterium sp.]|nr:Ig-like domain-containing protein [Pseudosphingobacterium sp.]
GNYFLSYDNERSIRAKAAYIKEQGLAGVIIWQVWGDMEQLTTNTEKKGDKLIISHDRTCVLVNALNDELSNGDGENEGPLVVLRKPLQGSQFNASDLIEVEAIARDNDGHLAKLELFRDGGIKLGESPISPYNISVNNLSVGVHSFYAKATDNLGKATTSTVITVQIKEETPEPQLEIEIISPDSGMQYPAPADISIFAETNIASSNVSKVSFYDGANELGQKTSPPYTYMWQGVPAGSYSLRVEATTSNGTIIRSSEPVIVQVTGQAENRPPVVSIISPTNGTEYTAPASITIQANASDPDGQVVKVEFISNNQKIGERTTAPYSYPYRIEAAGHYVLTARATDNDGDTTTSSPVQINVQSGGGDGGCGGVPAWSPTKVYSTSGEEVSYRNIIYRQFSWSQNMPPDLHSGPYQAWQYVRHCDGGDGGCGGVPAWVAMKLYNQPGEEVSYQNKIYKQNFNSQGAAPDVNSGWGKPWLFQRDCEDGGGDDNKPPEINITSPRNEASFSLGAEIPITVNVSDADGTVVKVEYFAANPERKIGESLIAPFSFTWKGAPAGRSTLFAKVTDNDSATATSPIIVINVEESNSNLPPTVQIISPVDGAEFPASANISIQAQASDTDGNIENVVFYRGNTLLTTKSAPPYDYLWTHAPSGYHVLRAVATDDQGRTAEGQVSVHVAGSGTPGEGDLEEIISAADWDMFFPNRFKGPDDHSGGIPTPANDFYSYANFLEAYRLMAEIEVTFERRCATNYYRVTWRNKRTGEELIIRNDSEFHDPQHVNSAIIVLEVDYANFAHEGSLETRKRELMAFLANISQETTGGWDGAHNGGRYAWGLHYREEVGYNDDSNAYRDETSLLYPPAPGKSYHGRGPIQLSWNYNYGQVSEFLYGHKDVLLEHPGKLLENGAFAFQTAIWFWMTPQYPKPSCHDVMIPLWTPTPEDEARGLKPGFGATVNIINGGLECQGHQTEFEKVVHRIGHYKRYTEIAGVSMELDGGNIPENCGCHLMGEFRIDSQECARATSLKFTSPNAGNAIGVNGLNAINIQVVKTDPNNEIEEVTITVGGEVFSGEQVNWTPSGYRQFLATAIGHRVGRSPVTASIEFAVYNELTFEGCEFIPAWNAHVVYPNGGQLVRFEGKIYRNSWYAAGHQIPGAIVDDQPWVELGACNATTGNRKS